MTHPRSVKGRVKEDGKFLYVNGNKITVFNERDPAAINWPVLVLSMLESQLVSSPQTRLLLTLRVVPGRL